VKATNYQDVLRAIDNPRGVNFVRFDDLNMAEAELVLHNLNVVDQQTITGTPTYVYRADIWVLEQATGKGVNLGQAIVSSDYIDLYTSDVYLRIWNLPNVEFADGVLDIMEGGANIAFRIQNDPPPPEGARFAGDDTASAQQSSLYEMFSLPTVADQSEYAGVADVSVHHMVQALSTFGIHSAADDAIFKVEGSDQPIWQLQGGRGAILERQYDYV
jgi:hypothetical protein